MLVSKRFLVSGRVQGVGFRQFTFNLAMKMGITGWVRNLESGQVEVFAVSSEEIVNNFLQQLRKGPKASRVDKIDIITDSCNRDADHGFVIR